MVIAIYFKSKVVAAYGAVPFPMMHGGSLPDALSACTDALPWKPLSACPEASDGRCYGQWATLKGFEGQRLIRSELNGCVCYVLLIVTKLYLYII